MRSPYEISDVLCPYCGTPCEAEYVDVGVGLVQVALARMDGYKLDKKQLRFNTLVAVARRYESLGANVLSGLQEALDACIYGDPTHVPGGSIETLVYDWMEA